MSFLIKEITLRNIRSHKHLSFVPELSGLSAIVGVNGTGKSTLVDSIGFALFGTKPHGVSKAVGLRSYWATEAYNSRKTDNLEKERHSSVSLTFTLHEEDYLIIRKFVNKAGAVECDFYKKIVDENGNVDDDDNDCDNVTGHDDELLTDGEDFNLPEKLVDPSVWEHLAGPSVSHSQPLIKKTLGLDEQGFLSAIFVQQKQVDQLITASGPDRAKIIENLLGITAISEAIKRSKNETSSLKKSLEVSHYDSSYLDSLKENEKKLTQELGEKKKVHQEESDRLNTLKKEGEVISAQHREESQLRKENVHSNERMTQLKNEISVLESELSVATKKKDDLKEKLSKKILGTNFEETEKEISNLRTKRDGLMSQIAPLNTKLDDLRGKLPELEGNLPSEEETRENLLKLTEEKMEINNTLEKLSKKIVAKESQVTELNNAMTIISDNHGSCPTCLQEVQDINGALSSLKTTQDSLEKEITETKKTSTELKGELTKLEKIIEKNNQVLEYIENIEEQTQLKEKITTFEGEKKSVESELKVLVTFIDRWKNQQEQKKQYEETLSTIQRYIKTIDTNRIEINTIKEKLHPVSSEREWKTLEKNLEKMRIKYQKEKEKVFHKETEIKVLEEKVFQLKENITREEKTWNTHKDILTKIEETIQQTQVLEKFRKDRIKTSLPQLEEYSSDLITKFTDGTINEVILDEKFNVTVKLNNGSMREVGLLSGGELSAVALAVRLGISILLNGGTGHNLMILDEVLVSMDFERSELIMNTIKEVCGNGQIIMIAHDENINNIADNVLDLNEKEI